MARYIDTTSIMQVIGNIFNNPVLLDNENYHFYEDDFTNEFHKVLFGAIHNSYMLGAKEINVHTIENYLQDKPKSLGVYTANNGSEYLRQISETASETNFNYYYQKMRKMTLLRIYNEKCHMDLSWLYDKDNIFDSKKKEKQDKWLDNTSIEKIADIIDKNILNVRLKYADNYIETSQRADYKLDELLEDLSKNPPYGYPLYGKYINTITKGARLKKFYLRSGSTGLGKTRTMIADAGYIGCSEIYDLETKKWISSGEAFPTLYITTEQEISEVQTMFLAFLSGVNEEHIIYNKYENDDEKERVRYAVNILKNSKLYIKELPDFSLQDIENTIKKAIRDYEVTYIFHDYIHTSLKILSEISSKAGVKGLREDNILFMISTRLKDICNQYNVFIMSGTQLNAQYQTADVFDQNLLRGAKAIADKVDYGSLLIPVTQEDRELLSELVVKMGLLEMPTIKMSVYKNRGNRYKNILLWCKADLGICRIYPLFVTDYQYNVIKLEDTQLNIQQQKQDNDFVF